MLPGGILKKLEGLEIYAIVFVRDYLQVQLDGAVLSFAEWPVVDGGRSLHFADAGYRDALCACIGLRIERAEVVDGQHLLLLVGGEGKMKLFLSLRDEDRTDPEMVRLELDNGSWSTW